MAFIKIYLLLVTSLMVTAQRPSFAGTKPIGFPEIEKAPNDPLGNRFGSGDGDKIELPIEANGDRDYIERLSKMPIDKQPFWFINWKKYEENRKNPQTFQQKPNVFNPNTNTVPIPNTNQGNTVVNQANSNSGLTSKFGSGNSQASNIQTTNNDKYLNDYDSFETNDDHKHQNYRQSRRSNRHY